MKINFKNAKIFVALVAVAVLLISCDDKGKKEDSDILVVNEWMHELMLYAYYWTDFIPEDLEPDGTTDPEDYFEKHLYSEEDKWSWMSDDYDALNSELDGVPVTMGYSPFFIAVGDNEVAIVVEYVYPGSPADKAGIKRGDVIYKINGSYLTRDNYYERYSGKEYNVSIGHITDNKIHEDTIAYSLTAEVVTADPLIYDTIITASDKKIGYLVYTGFTSGIGNQYLDNLGEKLESFSTQNVDDIVIDLRYNPGGEINASQFFASVLSPAQVASNKDTLIKMDYNDIIDNDPGFNPTYHYSFIDTDYNIDLSKVYFLTTKYTASASELLITGLDPYMEVVTIGESTYGKYTGAWVLHDVDDRHNYAIVPIVSKYQNANGVTDFKNGLEPDYNVKDDGLFAGIPFGDVTDPMLAKAVELITGEVPAIRQLSTKKAFSAEVLPNAEKQRKANLILNRE